MVRGTASLIPHRFTYSIRVLSNPPAARAATRNTLMYRLNDDLQIGVEYNPAVSEVGPLVNWRAVREAKRTPAIIFGTSSDRIGTPFGQAYYMTIGKQVSKRIGVYTSVFYSEFEQKILFPFGAHLTLSDRWSVLLSNDGVVFHPMTTYSWDRYSLTLLFVRARDPGVTFTVGF